MRQTATVVYVHLVWGTWDRLPLLVGEAKDAVYSCIHTECAEMKTEVLALGGIEDHVHLLVKIPPTVSISSLVKQVKGSSSHLASHARGVDFFKWQGSYDASSVSPAMLNQVMLYIQNQEHHHRNRILDDMLE